MRPFHSARHFTLCQRDERAPAKECRQHRKCNMPARSWLSTHYAQGAPDHQSALICWFCCRISPFQSAGPRAVELMVQHQSCQFSVLEFLIQSAILRLRNPYLPPAGPSGIAVRFQREVTMESQTLTGPLLYMIIAWGIVTAAFLVLWLRRSLLASHEDDQIFLDAAEEHMAREQRELVAKIEALSKPILGTGILAGVLLLVIAGMLLKPGLKGLF